MRRGINVRMHDLLPLPAFADQGPAAGRHDAEARQFKGSLSTEVKKETNDLQNRSGAGGLQGYDSIFSS